MTDYMSLLKERVQLKEGISALERVLGSLYFHSPVSTKALARKSLLPVPVVTAIKKEAIKLGIVAQQNGVMLTELGKQYLEEIFGYDGLDREKYERWKEIAKAVDRVTISGDTNKQGDPIDVVARQKDRKQVEGYQIARGMTFSGDTLVESLAEQLTGIYAGRPQVDVTLDQAYATPQTGIRRALLALEHDTLLGKNLLCVGDDDLVSVAIGFLLRALYIDFSKNKTQICVLEKDHRLAAYIQEIANQYHLPIKCVEADLRDPLPIHVVGHFDAFYTDPPYTIEGLSLFLSRGIGGLKKERGLPVFLSFGQKPNEDIYLMQEVFLAHGLVMTGIYDKFNQYEGASFYGNVSRMLVLETTDHTKAVIPVTLAGKEKIYTGDFRQVGTKYRCRSCGMEITTGAGEPFQTIEKAKEMGCSTCGGKIFDQAANKQRRQDLSRKGEKFSVQGISSNSAGNGDVKDKLSIQGLPGGATDKEKKYWNGESEARQCTQLDRNGTADVLYRRRALGGHILADFFGCNSDTLDDTHKIGIIMEEAARRAHATIVTKEFHRFSPCGVSGAIIIQESHLTIHTWPEYQYAAVDIFTCGDSLDLWKSMEYLKESLEASTMESTELGRGFFKFGGIDRSQ